ncbi:uncharacterized protein LOC131217545 [Magnolia sinica]|uniref:uncharacterized protein LOC131217545 n=1 Tax=Magnolia sinica TaxID=86752 RepID=UPI0026580073|nr:uncharacterized protein LOC131217545 [Magnolia sinica]
MAHVLWWLNILFPDVRRPQSEARFELVRWKLPRLGWAKLNLEGSTCGNLGVLGGGGLCRNLEGNILFVFAMGFGEGSSNRAELRAVWFGPSLCLAQGLSRIEVESDSKVVTNLIGSHSQHNWSRRHWLKRIEDHMTRGSFSLRRIPREENIPADSLAHLGSASQMYSFY